MRKTTGIFYSPSVNFRYDYLASHLRWYRKANVNEMTETKLLYASSHLIFYSLKNVKRNCVN